MALATIATPAHAAVYAHGTFSYSQNGVGVCTETYANTMVGTTTCAVTLTIGPFSLVTWTNGTCSGIANATMRITSPSAPGVPPPAGRFVVTNGVGHFTGHATNGLVLATGQAFRSGSLCTPEVLNAFDSFSGVYDLHA